MTQRTRMGVSNGQPLYCPMNIECLVCFGLFSVPWILEDSSAFLSLSVLYARHTCLIYSKTSRWLTLQYLVHLMNSASVYLLIHCLNLTVTHFTSVWQATTYYLHLTHKLYPFHLFILFSYSISWIFSSNIATSPTTSLGKAGPACLVPPP